MIKLKIKMTKWTVTVSYTHLDVYKRQGQYFKRCENVYFPDVAEKFDVIGIDSWLSLKFLVVLILRPNC